MNCPACSGVDHRVLRTDEARDRILRTRQCGSCGKRWRTAEVPVDVLERAEDVREALEMAIRAVGPE